VYLTSHQISGHVLQKEGVWQSVADTGKFGGGNATSICNEPNAS